MDHPGDRGTALRYEVLRRRATREPGRSGRERGGGRDRLVGPGSGAGGRGAQEIALFPPTAVTLGELRACGTVPAALAARRRMTPLIPEVMVADGAAWLTVPDSVEYPL